MKKILNTIILCILTFSIITIPVYGYEEEFDDILENIYVTESSIDNTSIQTFVLELTSQVENVSLVVLNQENLYVVDCASQEGFVYTFMYTFEKSGIYIVQELNYSIDGNNFEYNLEEMNISFEVIEEAIDEEASMVVQDNNVLEGYTVSLDGSIGVNFYMSLNEETIGDEGAYLLCNIPTNDSYMEQRIYVKDVEAVTYKYKEYYVFPCKVAAKEMTKTMNVQLVTSKGNEKVYSFSVNEYANYILEHSNSYTNRDMEIVKALQQYGAASQNYFNYHLDNLPASLNVRSVDFSSHKKSVSTSNSVEFIGARLVLKSNLGLKLYFKGEGSFSVDGQVITTSKEHGYTVVYISNVNVTEIEHMYTVQCQDFSMQYGVLSYGQDVKEESLKNILYALVQLKNAIQLEEENRPEELSAEYDTNGYYFIMGTGHVSVDQMVAYYNSKGYTYDTFPKYGTTYDGVLALGGASTIEEYCQIFYEECKKEGINVQVAFIQAMLETGYLQYGGDVKPDQYNFAGLGATGGGVQGNVFTDVRTGIRAQVQHLKCYASTEPLNNECVDQRWGDWLRGKAIYVEYLSIPNNPYKTGWAGSATYANNILSMINDLKKF